MKNIMGTLVALLFVSCVAQGQDAVDSAASLRKSTDYGIYVIDKGQLKAALDKAGSKINQGNLSDATKSIESAKKLLDQVGYEYILVRNGNDLPRLPGEHNGFVPPVLPDSKVLACSSDEQIVITGQWSAKCVKTP